MSESTVLEIKMRSVRRKVAVDIIAEEAAALDNKKQREIRNC